MFQERRESQRRLMPEPRIIINGKMQGYLEDISKLGAGLVLNENYAENSTFDFTIDFGHFFCFEQIKIQKAKVNWSHSKHSYDLYKVGVEFLEITDAGKKKLEQYLSFWEKEHPPVENRIEMFNTQLQNYDDLSVEELQALLAKFCFFRLMPLSYNLLDLKKTLELSKKLEKTLEKISSYSSLEIKDLTSTIKAFESSQDLATQELRSKEDTIQAYEQLQSFMREELIQKEQILSATQKALELANQEQRAKDDTIKALELVSSMMREEQIEKDQIIDAQQRLQEIARKELLDKEGLINAFEELEKMHRKEMKDKDDLLSMHSILEDLSRKELLEKDKEIQVRSLLSDLAKEEVLERQRVIDAYDQFAEVVHSQIINKDKLIDEIKESERKINNENV